jgi:hypothetical protein
MSTRSQVSPSSSPFRSPVSRATFTTATSCLVRLARHALNSRASSSGSNQRTRPCGSGSSLIRGTAGSASHSSWASWSRWRSAAKGRLMPAGEYGRPVWGQTAASLSAFHVLMRPAVMSVNRVSAPK